MNGLGPLTFNAFEKVLLIPCSLPPIPGLYYGKLTTPCSKHIQEENLGVADLNGNSILTVLLNHYLGEKMFAKLYVTKGLISKICKVLTNTTIRKQMIH